MASVDDSVGKGHKGKISSRVLSVQSSVSLRVLGRKLLKFISLLALSEIKNVPRLTATPCWQSRHFGLSQIRLSGRDSGL